MNLKFNHFVVYYLPVALWMALIFKLSSGTVPATSDVYWQDFAAKKLAHVLFFGFLSMLVYRALVASGVGKVKAVYFAILFTVIYGATDEFHQSLVSGREARLRDVGFDGIGALLATTSFNKILERSKKWQEKLL